MSTTKDYHLDHIKKIRTGFTEKDYHEVFDENQSILKTRWVITEEEKVKARLVVRGFQ